MMGHTDSQRLMFLDALEAAGVDNWEGYDEAIQIYREYIREGDQQSLDDENS